MDDQLKSNLTAQQEVERRLKHSESRYRALLQQAADSMFIHDFNGRILEVNQQACDTLGYSSDELCRMHLADIAPNFQLNINQPKWELLELGKPVCFNSTHRHRDGRIFPVEVRLVSLEIDNQKLVMALASDISERVRIASALQESELRYRNFAEQMPMGIFITQDGLIRYVNNASIELIGYAEHELLDQPFLPLVHEADQPWLIELHQRRMRGERVTPRYEVRMVRKDGAVRHWEMYASTIEWKGRLSGLGIVADITERKRAEAKLQDAVAAQLEAQRRAALSQSRYETLIKHAADAVFVFDIDGRFIEVNQQACDSLAYPREELLNMTVSDISPSFDLSSRQPVWRNLEYGKPYRIVSSHRRKDGSVFPVEIRLAALKLDDEKLLMALASDISERLSVEKKLLDTVQLLEEKELSKTRFLAAAGHDLRQPVAAANLFVDALKLTAPTEQQRQLIERLDQSMTVFSCLLERLLDISKFDAGLIKPEFSRFNLAELFNWLEQNFALLAQDQQLSFRLRFPKKRTLVVRTDIGLLQSVVMNLVSNALKFTAQGGILVSARIRRDRVLLQVWDTGCGIAPVDLPKIFDEFFQANNPQRNREAGLGLGLSICQRAMSLLGGKINCHSRLGHGSVFEFALPLNPEPQQTGHIGSKLDRPGEIAAAASLRGKQIVVVEDDALVATGLINLLLGLGAQVQHFQTAEEALRHTHLASADFFIADYALGGQLNGLQFLEAVQHRRGAPIRATLITGETSSQFISKISSSPWPVLHKPFNLGKLLATLLREPDR